MRNLSPQYLAGVADSDGSFSIAARHKSRPVWNYCSCFQLTWKYSKEAERIFKEIKRTYGGSYNIHSKKQSAFGKSIRVIKLFMSGQSLEKFLREVGPYVVLKKKQVALLSEQRSLTEYGVYGYGRPKSSALKKREKQLYLLNKKLNTKNRKDKSETLQNLG